MGAASTTIATIVDSIVDGTYLDAFVASFPIVLMANMYKRGGRAMVGLFCLNFLPNLPHMIPISKKGFLGWFLRGTLIPFVFVEYLYLRVFLTSFIEESSYSPVNRT